MVANAGKMAKSAKKATPPEVVSNRCLEIEAKTRQPTWAHPRGAVGLAGAARLAETGPNACAAYGSMPPNSASRPYTERSSSSPSVMVGPKCRQLRNHHLGHRALCPASGSQHAQPPHSLPGGRRAYQQDDYGQQESPHSITSLPSSPPFRRMGVAVESLPP